MRDPDLFIRVPNMNVRQVARNQQIVSRVPIEIRNWLSRGAVADWVQSAKTLAMFFPRNRSSSPAPHEWPHRVALGGPTEPTLL